MHTKLIHDLPASNSSVEAAWDPYLPHLRLFRSSTIQLFVPLKHAVSRTKEHYRYKPPTETSTSTVMTFTSF